ncbi:hypothetical protein GH714_004598 [Hevea brasiliensis]|uniref:Uncharacterized protein n=1 Tax=Hevea brasiliensis TaxID=3981 RepID=A0A6A6NBH0_HEVBR|nr:hypothetical protein GH714_004598 [Hevea brasiliensis]
MTPAQPLMDIHPDYEHHSTKVEVDIDDETILAKSDGMRSKCVDNCGETVGERGTLLDEQTKPMDPEDVEVDIITYKNSKETRSAGPEDPDATEYSSSFANTFSDDEKCSGRSETEVESQFLGDSYLASPYDAFSSIFKTRKCHAFSSSENPCLLAPCDGHTSSAASPTFPAGNGDTMSIEAMHNANQQISGCDIGDLIMPDSAISSCGETIEVPDLIESTVGMLAADDVTFHQPQIGDSCEDIVDNVLTHTESTKGERDTFIGTDNQLLEKHHEQEKGEEESTNPCPVTTLEPDPTAKTTFSEEQSTLKSCLASDFQFQRTRESGERGKLVLVVGTRNVQGNLTASDL